MSLKRTGLFAAAATIFAAVWFGPLPDLARQSFAVHMTMHIAVVAVAAPLLALALSGTSADPVVTMPRMVAAIPASMLEFVIVWAWHVPALHNMARHQRDAFALEQVSFAVAGLMLWVAAVGGTVEQRRLRAGEGTVALLLTSMHMTLLGSLFAMAPRTLFRHGTSTDASLIGDQQLGGVIMLLVGGASYLAGGLILTASALRPHAARALDINGRCRE
jgi:putative membrane protein